MNLRPWISFFFRMTFQYEKWTSLTEFFWQNSFGTKLRVDSESKKPLNKFHIFERYILNSCSMDLRTFSMASLRHWNISYSNLILNSWKINSCHYVTLESHQLINRSVAFNFSPIGSNHKASFYHWTRKNWNDFTTSTFSLW